MASNVVANQDQSQQESGAPFNASTVKTVSKIPLMTVNAGPRDAVVEQAVEREFTALILYIKNNKAEDNDWLILNQR